MVEVIARELSMTLSKALISGVLDREVFLPVLVYGMVAWCDKKTRLGMVRSLLNKKSGDCLYRCLVEEC